MRKSIYTRRYRVFTQLLKDVRIEAAISQAELALKLGVAQPDVSKMETGDRRIDIVEAQLWCEALGISLETFAARLERKRFKQWEKFPPKRIKRRKS